MFAVGYRRGPLLHEEVAREFDRPLKAALALSIIKSFGQQGNQEHLWEHIGPLPRDAHRWIWIEIGGSSLLDKANAEVMLSRLQPYVEQGLVYDTKTGGQNYEIYLIKGMDPQQFTQAVTPAFEEYYKICQELSEYPSLDDMVYSRLQYEDTCETLNEYYKYYVERPSEDWEGLVFSWLWDNAQNELESINSDGEAFPNKPAVLQALVETGRPGTTFPLADIESIWEELELEETCRIYALDRGIYVAEFDASTYFMQLLEPNLEQPAWTLAELVDSPEDWDPDNEEWFAWWDQEKTQRYQAWDTVPYGVLGRIIYEVMANERSN